MSSSAQKGYISIFIIIFGLLLAFFVQPLKTPVIVKDTKCQLGNEPPSPPFFETMPKIFDRDGPLLTAEEAATGRVQGGPDNSQPPVQYRLIREKVPVSHFRDDIFKLDEHTIGTITKPVTKHGETKKYKVYYPTKYGELDMKDEFKPSYSNYSPITGREDQYRWRQEGIIFYLLADDNGPITYQIDGKNVYTVDIYQEDTIYTDPTRKYDDNGVIFDCSQRPNETFSKDFNSAVLPSQNKSQTKEQLQLEWFVFQDAKYMAAHCKPAIYLYPEDKTLVNVKVNTKGFLTYTDPQYDSKTGWTVTAYPDGAIESTNPQLLTKNYPYLYYESKVPDSLIKKPSTGFVVKYEDLNNLYHQILPRLGLNTSQTQDFIDYWDKALKNDSPYYFVGILNQDNIAAMEPLEITPKPDSVNRVRIYFERLSEFKNVQAPKLTNNYALNPNSFSVVEWGGMIKNDLNHPFTCSQ